MILPPLVSARSAVDLRRGAGVHMQDHHDGDAHPEQTDRALVPIRLRVSREAGHTAGVSDTIRAAYPDRRLLERVLCAGAALSIYAVFRLPQVRLD